MDLISMRRYEAPWRIVPPAIVFNFILAVLTTYTTLNVEAGYKEFSNGIKDVFLQLCDKYKLPKTSRCEIIQMYVKIFNYHDHDVCNLFSWMRVVFRKHFCRTLLQHNGLLNSALNALQAFSGIMMWSWISGLVIVALRVVIVNDFRISRVTIYEVPRKHTSRNSKMGSVEESSQSREKDKVS